MYVVCVLIPVVSFKQLKSKMWSVLFIIRFSLQLRIVIFINIQALILSFIFSVLPLFTKNGFNAQCSIHRESSLFHLDFRCYMLFCMP